MTVDHPPVAFCQSCTARIHWYRTTTGRRIPVNVEPSPNGNIRIDADLFGAPIATVVSDGTGDRLSHFVTCPDADRWRTG